ncbi:electron transfer flavoprotein subunit alpha/FixB family protein [Desulfobacula sp.]|uniref:electron transfer flavoprotein subunit alpha/FixB family protein n=1 Tax=Desulfobacula sp. TaxID=2593537 RepID=UPI002624AA47|nr:electron transfer flavoprotein subunit alpha/FixB family protein [Desulfobacula sp.]
MSKKSNKDVWIYGEVTDGELDVKTLELLTMGKKLAIDLDEELAIVLMGDNLDPVAQDLAGFGPDKIYKVESPLLNRFNGEIWVDVLEKLFKELKPRVFLASQSFVGIEVAPRLAFRLDCEIITDCIDLKIDPDDGSLIKTKAIYGGNVVATFKQKGATQMATVREKANKLAERGAELGKIIDIKPDIDESIVKIQSLEVVREDVVALNKADVIISGGRGIGGIEGFEELATLVPLFKESFANVIIGASRPAIDSGWISSNRQIGLTGEMVAPDFYIAVGISGAIQHIAGMSKSKTVVAINKDEDSNIFNLADYGVVGDYREILPAFKKKWGGV